MKVYDTEWQCTFYLDGDYSTRLILEHWLAYVDGSMSGSFEDIVPSKNLMGTITSKLTSKLKDKALSIGKGLGASVGDTLLGVGESGSMLIDSGIKKVSSVFGDTPMTTNYVTDAYDKFIEERVPVAMEKMRKLAEDLNNDDNNTNTSSFDLFGTIRITPMDYSNTTPIATYVLHNAFPMALQAIQFDDTNINGISEFTASFAFSHYTIERAQTFEEMATDLF